MDSTFDRLIHLYIEGRLDAALEEVLFRELAQNNDLRRAMNAHIRLQTAAKRDAARIVPTRADKAAIFGRVGLAVAGMPSIARTTPSVAQTFLSAKASTLLSAQSGRIFLRYAATILVTAFLTWWLLRFGISNGIENSQRQAMNTSVEQTTPIEMTMIVPIERRIERVIEKQVVTRVETRYRTITRYIRQNGDTAAASAFLAVERMNTDAVNIGNGISQAGNRLQNNLTQSSFAQNQNNVPQNTALQNTLQNNGIYDGEHGASTIEPAPHLAFANNFASPVFVHVSDSITKPLFPARPVPKEFIPTAFFALRTAIDMGTIQGAWLVRPFSAIAGMVGYDWTENGIIGLEASGDVINQRQENGVTVPFLPVASAFYRHSFNDWTVEVAPKVAVLFGERITPFVQANIGASGETVAARLMLGATFYGVSPDKRRWSNSLGLELTHLFATPQASYVPKVSLCFSQNLRL